MSPNRTTSAAAKLAGVSRQNQSNGLSSSAANTTPTRRLRRAARSQTSSGGGARSRPTAKTQSEQTSSGRQQPTEANEPGELEAQHQQQQQQQQRSIKNVTAQNGKSRPSVFSMFPFQLPFQECERVIVGPNSRLECVP